jgi:hypothetical protein
LAQEEILERSRPQGGQSLIHPFGVSDQNLAITSSSSEEALLSPLSKVMASKLAVAWHESLAQKRRQLSRGTSSQKVHLEESILGVEIAEGTSRIDSILRFYGRNTERVTGHSHRLAQTRQFKFAFEMGQARAE